MAGQTVLGANVHNATTRHPQVKQDLPIGKSPLVLGIGYAVYAEAPF